MCAQPEQPHDATLAWDVLSERVEALVSAWESSSEPPGLAEFLPEHPANLRHLVLVELIKVDLEYRSQRPEYSRRLEHYVDDFPELASGGEIPCDLIYEEFHLRKQSGQPVEVSEYYERFPRSNTIAAAAGAGITASQHVGRRRKPVRGNRGRREGRRLRPVDARLGRGAFATVFLARQISMQRIVALKISADRGQRAADNGAARSSQHRARVRPAIGAGTPSQTALHAVLPRWHAANRCRCHPAYAPQRGAPVRGYWK